MAAKINLNLIIGVVVAVAGLAALAYGFYQYSNLQSNLVNAVVKFAGGSTQAETTAVMTMIGGGAAALVGGVIALRSGRR